MLMDTEALRAACEAVLKHNDRGNHTIPAHGPYPHQWLWDSCFIAIGLRHSSHERAMTEIKSLLKGQWSNGMLPHIIFAKGRQYEAERRIWFSKLSPCSPNSVATSGITQPPMVAEAVQRIGEQLTMPERRTWYKAVWPQLLAYHEWLYRERDPHGEGLTMQIIPFETGLDNTPPWIAQLHEHNRPWWIGIIARLHIDRLFNLLRRDTKMIPIVQRMSTIEELIMYWDIIPRMKRKRYNIDKILHRSLFAIEDVTFNSILVRANTILKEIAKDCGEHIPEYLLERFELAEIALEALWEPGTQSYYSRDFITHKLLPEQSVGALLPLYSGAISKERADVLVTRMKEVSEFWPAHPVPSVPLNAPEFNPVRYWQGPAWININWLLIDGLRRYGYIDEAVELAAKTMQLVADSGPYEYFNPLDGQPLGSANFSWSAALVLDLLKSLPQAAKYPVNAPGGDHTTAYSLQRNH